jgi:hypothetical protein
VWSELKYLSPSVVTQSASCFTPGNCPVALLPSVHMSAAVMYQSI